MPYACHSGWIRGSFACAGEECVGPGVEEPVATRFRFEFVLPNVELTGRRRMDALPVRRSIDSERRAGKVASRWSSG